MRMTEVETLMLSTPSFLTEGTIRENCHLEHVEQSAHCCSRNHHLVRPISIAFLCTLYFLPF